MFYLVPSVGVHKTLICKYHRALHVMECELRRTQVHKERHLEDTSKDLQAMGTHAAANSAVTPGHVAPQKHFLPSLLVHHSL